MFPKATAALPAQQRIWALARQVERWTEVREAVPGMNNLLVSLVFIFAIVTALAVPCHLYFAGQDNPDIGGVTLTDSQFRFWLTAAILASLVVGVVGTVLPLRIGIKAFQRMEF